MQTPMIAGVGPETTHDFETGSRAKRPIATVALIGTMVLLGAACLYDGGAAAPVERETGHLMDWILATRAEGFALAPAMPRAANMAPAATNIALGKQLDLQRDALEQSLNAGPGAVHVDTAAQQLQAVLALDDVALMDEELRAMVQSRALDSAFAYELARTADLAAEAGDHGDAEVLQHLQTQLTLQAEHQVLGPLFEQTLATILSDVQSGVSMAQAVETHLGAQDVAFVPELAERFAAVAQKLRAVLQAGKVEKMEKALASLVRDGKVGVGFLLLLAQAQEVATPKNKPLLAHLNRVLRYELRLAPAHSLVSQLLAAPASAARAALLARHLPAQETLPAIGYRAHLQSRLEEDRQE
jgi:hypothetical protein